MVLKRTMANQNYTVNRTYEPGWVRTTLDHADTSVNSSKVAGQLVLRSNPHRWRHARQELFHYDSGFAFRSAPADAATLLFDIDNSGVWTRLENEALARFTGKVRRDHASLGMTLATAKQSRDMIADRAHKIARIFDHPVKLASKLTPRQRRQRAASGLAGDVLEGEFGWVPLVSDIKDALGALARSDPDGWIMARSETSLQTSVMRNGSSVAYDSIINNKGKLWVTVGAKVRIENPNLFLANRLGLLNFPATAWDRVPWSFVVNMFTNMNQMVNSITDFVGVNTSFGSTTRVSDVERHSVCYAGFAPGQYQTKGRAESRVHEKQRRRVTDIPVPKFQFKAPELDMNLAAIAVSLIVQRINKLNKLFGATPF